MEMPEGVEPVRTWLAVAIAGFVVIVAGAIAFPRPVYDGFLWRYFWGPVVADGNAAQCAVRLDGSTTLLYETSACRSADGIVAYPGYTTTSTVSYAVVLIFMLIGVLLLLDRLDVRMSPQFFYALFPFMLLGGALRTIEDVNATFLRQGIDAPIAFPASALIISPFIYFVMFAFTLAALVVALALARRGVVDRYEPLLGGVGAVALVAAVGWLLYQSATTAVVGFYPIVAVITLVGATAIAAAVWVLTERFAPVVNEGTGWMGVLVVWGHTVDGIANVLSLDWAAALGLPVSYGPKHVVNRLLINLAETVQPESVTAAIGTAWPFLVVKVVVAGFVVYIFDRTIFEESPLYAYLLFIAILAVGLGPGTRDMLRATFGV